MSVLFFVYTHTSEGETQLYIDPNVCIDCAACVDVCPVEAIFMQSDVPNQWESFIDINSKFFETFVYPEKEGDRDGADGKSRGKEQGIPEEYVQLPDAVSSSLRIPFNVLSELADHYRIEIEFPRWVPNSAAKERNDLPDRMPHYDYEVSISSPYVPDSAVPPESIVTVQTQLPRDPEESDRFSDPRFEKVVGRTSSFPDGFRNIFPIQAQPDDFHAKDRNRMLEIIVPKTGTYEELGIELPVHYAKLKG